MGSTKIGSENSDNTRILLDLILSYVDGADSHNVDGLAMQIRDAGITPKNRIPVSLASKVLMLSIIHGRYCQWIIRLVNH